MVESREVTIRGKSFPRGDVAMILGSFIRYAGGGDERLEDWLRVAAIDYMAHKPLPPAFPGVMVREQVDVEQLQNFVVNVPNTEPSRLGRWTKLVDITSILVILAIIAIVFFVLSACATVPQAAALEPPTVSCALVGDSLVTHAGLGQFFPECVNRSAVGRHAYEMTGTVPAAQLVIFSAGSNDLPDSELITTLHRLRQEATGDVLWVVPAEDRRAAIVLSIASIYGDQFVFFTPGRDFVHPASYSDLASLIRGLL